MKEITLTEYNTIKARNKELTTMGIKPFTDPSHKWMQRTVKYRMRNVFNLGVWQVNWSKLVK